MDYRDRGYQAVQTAEETLRATIADALDGHAYKDVAALADAADALSVLVRKLTPHAPRSSVSEPTVVTAPPPSAPDATSGGEIPATVVSPPTSVTRREKYPQYRRDGEMLIKVAWSKKNRRPYEHRAPRRIVQLLVDKIRRRYDHVGDEQVFDASHIMPLWTPNQEEYPSYQVYLALGWLRHVGAVSKKGRSGYVLRSGKGTPTQLEALWRDLPT